MRCNLCGKKTAGTVSGEIRWCLCEECMKLKREEYEAFAIGKLCGYGLNEMLCKGCDCITWCAHTPGHGHGPEYERFLKRLSEQGKGKDEQQDKAKEDTA